MMTFRSNTSPQGIHHISNVEFGFLGAEIPEWGPVVATPPVGNSSGIWGPYVFFRSSEMAGSGSLRPGTSGRRSSEHEFRDGDRQAPAPGSAPCWYSVFSKRLQTCASVKCFNTPFVFE